VIDKAVDQWRIRMRVCVKAIGHHFEHMLQISADYRRDFQSHPHISEEDNTHNRSFFVVNVFSGNVAT